MTQDELFDAGAPLERTQMAWTRTGLAMLATSAVSVRLLLSGPPWLVAAVVALGVPTGTALLLLGQRRYARIHRQQWSVDSSPAVELSLAAGRSVAAVVALFSALLALASVDGAG